MADEKQQDVMEEAVEEAVEETVENEAVEEAAEEAVDTEAAGEETEESEEADDTPPFLNFKKPFCVCVGGKVSLTSRMRSVVFHLVRA